MGVGGPGAFGATNMLSDVDFERAVTDIEDEEDDQSYYIEEEVTDEEAMEKQKADLKKERGDDEDEDSDDSDMGFYMPSIIAKTGSSPTKKDSGSKSKLEKITKTIRIKKKKPSSSKKPPRQGSPPLGRQRRPAINLASDNNINRKSQTMSEEAKNAMQITNPKSQ